MNRAEKEKIEKEKKKNLAAYIEHDEEEYEEIRDKSTVSPKKYKSERKKEIKKRFLLLILLPLAASIGIAAGGYYFIYQPEMARRAVVAKAKADADVAKAKAKADAEAARVEAETKAQAAVEVERQRKLRLAVIGQGEGVIHPYTRQLIDNPGQVDGLIVKIGKKEYDLTYQGDKSDTDIKKWAQNKACIIAIASGYLDIGKHKREIRIKKAGEKAFLIVVNSDQERKRAAVDVYEKKISSGDYSADYYRIFLTDVNEQIVFLADSQNGVGPDLYVWSPKTRK